MSLAGVSWSVGRLSRSDSAVVRRALVLVTNPCPIASGSRFPDPAIQYSVTAPLFASRSMRIVHSQLTFRVWKNFSRVV
jgi:hypothetical protein